MADCKTCEYKNVCEMPDFVRNDLKNCKVYEIKKKQTNADLIRAMSDEELAEWLALIDHYWDDGECVVNFGDAHIHDSKDDILEWLQSEVNSER